MRFDDLQRDVISRGLCTGCGTCAGVCPSELEMVYGDHELGPVLRGECIDCSLCYDCCPGKDIPFPELEQKVYGRKAERAREPLGIYRTCLAGYARDKEIRQAGTSGGVASALLICAIESGLIDVAMVGEMNHDFPWRTQPLVASGREEVLRAAKTKSQVVATNASIAEALGRGSRIGHVGLGCHVHALRKLQTSYATHKMSRALSFSLGLFCFTNYYTIAAELLILERTPVKSLDEVAKMEYRDGKPRGNFSVTDKQGRVFTIPGGESHTFLRSCFQRDRCKMCLDWCNELADISLGDYWGPAVAGQDMTQGWSTIIVRTESGERLLREAESRGYLFTTSNDPAYLKLCGGFYQKNHANVYNILERKRFGYPTPDFGRSLAVEPVKRFVTFDFTRAPHLKWRAEADRQRPNK